MGLGMGSKTWYATKHAKNGETPHPGMGAQMPGGPINGSMNPVTECYHWERHRVEVTYALTANCDVITILRINKICNVALMSGIFSWFLIELV